MHPLTLLPAAAAAERFCGAQNSSPVAGVAAATEGARVLWEGQSETVVFDLADPATTAALSADYVLLRRHRDGGPGETVLRPVRHTGAYGPWDSHRAAGVADAAREGVAAILTAG